MNEIQSCFGPGPLLWKGLFYFIPILTVVLFYLALRISVRICSNKKRSRKIIDKFVKIHSLWFGVVFLSLISYGIIGLDYNYYLLEFFIVTLLTLGGFYIGERHRLFKISHAVWIASLMASLLFALIFSISFVSAVGAYEINNDKVQSQCSQRIWF